MIENLKGLSRPLRVVTVLSSLALLATACARPGFQVASQIADSSSDSVGCQSFQSDFFDGLYRAVETKSALPPESEMRAAFAASVASGRLKSLNPADQLRVSDELTNLYRLLALDSLQTLGTTSGSAQQKLAALTALEIGDSTTPEKEHLQELIQSEFRKLNQLTSAAQVACSKSPSPTNGASAPTLDNDAPATGDMPTGDAPTNSNSNKSLTLFSLWKATKPRVVYGALKAMSTAYQSCEAGLVPALGKETHDVSGIKIIGTHPDGIGMKRVIASIDDLLRTHPYLQNYSRPSSVGCFDVRKNVPIYDYGGRPVTSTGAFDIFQSAGSGTTALGTDCSGYVYMSIAASGLRIKKATALKAVTINGITSTLFTNPQKKRSHLLRLRQIP